jgi:hypothetical protein
MLEREGFKVSERGWDGIGTGIGTGRVRAGMRTREGGGPESTQRNED